MRLRTTTVVAMEVSKATFDEIAGKLREAGYDQAFTDEGMIDMRGIALSVAETAPDAHCVTTADGGCESTDPRCMHQPSGHRALSNLG